MKRILKDKTFIKGVYDTTYLPKYLQACDQKALIKEMNDKGLKLDTKDLLSSIIIPDSEQLKVLSPITGVYYESATPNDKPYIAEGDIIELDTVFCQLEAMKIFNATNLKSLNSDITLYSKPKYKVVKINISDASQVNEGDLLMVVEPL